MTYNEFHNALRVLMNIDADELENAGVIDIGDARAWDTFSANPWDWFIRAGTERGMKLWRLMEERMS